tara:strand:+ start:3065 stop:3790 length:726 start_codon:yes stop_codon:yes gene_type:complete
MRTWIPQLNNRGIMTVFLVGDETISEEYKLVGNTLLCKCKDEHGYQTYKTKIFLKWVEENCEYDYVFRCDDDTYVHSDRLLDCIDEYSKDSSIDYIGHVMPNIGYNPYLPVQEWICHDRISELIKGQIYWASGCAYLLTKKIISVILDGIDNEIDDWIKHKRNLSSEDLVIGRILKSKGFKLYHDGRFFPMAPFPNCDYPNTKVMGGVDKNSPIINSKNRLIAQNYMFGKMDEIHKEIISK